MTPLSFQRNRSAHVWESVGPPCHFEGADPERSEGRRPLVISKERPPNEVRGGD